MKNILLLVKKYIKNMGDLFAYIFVDNSEIEKNIEESKLYKYLNNESKVRKRNDDADRDAVCLDTNLVPLILRKE
jgi:hypothetical protein